MGEDGEVVVAGEIGGYGYDFGLWVGGWCNLLTLAWSI